MDHLHMPVSGQSKMYKVSSAYKARDEHQAPAWFKANLTQCDRCQDRDKRHNGGE